MKKVVFIPARYQSSRLPGKPLVLIKGRQMILRVCDQVAKAVDPQYLYVLTDDKRILDCVTSAGYQCLMTSDECRTGTDRIADAAQQIEFDVAINVQGDEPLMDPDDVRRVYDQANDTEIINGYAPIDTAEELNSPTVPKAVFDRERRLLYMSRAPIPNSKQLNNHRGFKQVCIYTFPKKALREYGVGKAKTPLESVEDIEILRLVEKGYTVRMEQMKTTIAVDVPEDVARVEQLIP